MRGVFFGVEFDNDEVPNAEVIAGQRSGKFVKWVQEYMPTEIVREDGKKVWRERRVVQCPMGFRLRRDEILGEMKRHKTDNYQDAKFFVVEAHAIGVHTHPVKAKMEKEAKEKADAERKIRDEKASTDAGANYASVPGKGETAKGKPGDTPTEPIVARVDNASVDKGSVVGSAGEGSEPTDLKD